MTAILFDTLKYSKGAEEVGFTKQQADYQAQQLATLIDNQLVTKSFLSNELLKLEMRLSAFIIKSNITLGSVLVILMAIFKFMK